MNNNRVWVFAIENVPVYSSRNNAWHNCFFTSHLECHEFGIGSVTQYKQII